METANIRFFDQHNEELGRQSFEFEVERYFTTTKEENLQLKITDDTSRLFIWVEDILDKNIELTVMEDLGTMDNPSVTLSGYTAYQIDGSYLNNVINESIPIVVGYNNRIGVGTSTLTFTQINSGNTVIAVVGEPALGTYTGEHAHTINQLVSKKPFLTIPIINNDTDTTYDNPLFISINTNPDNAPIHCMLVKEV